MEQTKWQDVTQQILKVQKDLKLLDLIKDHSITLQQCMQSQQINDEKMDPKYDISSESTVSHYIKNNLLKLPHQLSPQEIALVFAKVFQLEASVLKGNSLPSSIYTFSYLYDDSIYSQSLLFQALVDSVFTLGSHVYSILKQSCSVKEDDVNISTMSYIRNYKSHDQVIENILKAEKYAQNQSKKGESKASYNFIISILRVRRTLHVFAKSSGKKYVPEKNKKINDDLQAIKKRLIALKELPFEQNKQVNNIFFPQISKILRVHFGPRDSQKLSLKESIEQVENMIEQISLFFPLPSKISQYRHRLEILESKKYNAWSKSYIKVSIFAKEDYIFSVLKTEDGLINDINDWVPLSQNVKNSDKFMVLIRHAAQLVSQTLYRMLGNDMRWQFQCSKIYEDLNILVHLANQLDTQITAPHRELYICSWFYYYGVNLMIKQMMVGLRIGLYHVNEAKPVCYALQNLFGVYQKNAQIHLRKIDKAFLLNFRQKNFNKKLKKKMNDNSKRMFADIIYKNCLYYYFKSLFRLICILHNRQLVKNTFQSTQKTRIQNRFRIFKHVLFLKVIQYDEYKSTVQDVCKKEGQYLEEAIQCLKQMKENLQLFTSQFEQSQLNLNQKINAQNLTKSSIKASLVAMTLKMKAANKKFEIDFTGQFPEINMK